MGARKGTKPPAMGMGRPKGSQNKMTIELKDMILTALSEAGGVKYLKDRAIDTPGPFLTLVGKVLPLQVAGVNGGPLIIEVLKFADAPHKD